MILTITGPSCAGKSTLENLLVERGLSKAISTTTRLPRAGEVDGEAYYFVTKEQFLNALRAGEMVEHIELGGNHYGLSKAEVERLNALGKPIVVVCEPVGQKQIAQYCELHGWPIHSVFVDNPPAIIAKRFIGRLAEEAAEGLGLDGKAVESHSRRLADMMTLERRWQAEAYSQDIYDTLLHVFDEVNSGVVAYTLAEIAFKRLERKVA